MGWKSDVNEIILGRPVRVLYFDKATKWVDKEA
jgi:hypothetical protein